MDNQENQALKSLLERQNDILESIWGQLDQLITLYLTDRNYPRDVRIVGGRTTI